MSRHYTARLFIGLFFVVLGSFQYREHSVKGEYFEMLRAVGVMTSITRKQSTSCAAHVERSYIKCERLSFYRNFLCVQCIYCVCFYFIWFKSSETLLFRFDCSTSGRQLKSILKCWTFEPPNHIWLLWTVSPVWNRTISLFTPAFSLPFNRAIKSNSARQSVA